jgi:hypothetical protein
VGLREIESGEKGRRQKRMGESAGVKMTGIVVDETFCWVGRWGTVRKRGERVREKGRERMRESEIERECVQSASVCIKVRERERR